MVLPASPGMLCFRNAKKGGPLVLIEQQKGALPFLQVPVYFAGSGLFQPTAL